MHANLGKKLKNEKKCPKRRKTRLNLKSSNEFHLVER